MNTILRRLVAIALSASVLACERVVEFYEDEPEVEVQLADLLHEPRLISPKNGRIIGTSSQILLRWRWVPAASTYSVEVAHDSLFTQTAFSALVDTTLVRTTRLEGSTFYWRVRSNKDQQSSPWSDIFKFYLRTD